MILGLDVWEGSLEIDETTLKANGVGFIIPRLNSISGGLHLDDEFARQWAEAAGFLRAPSYVYNPWVSGKANADWLLTHLPSDAPLRVFCDIEVRKDGYSPVTYANEVNYFIGHVINAGYQPCIYTGAWFLTYLSDWPNNVPYWWARYPFFLYPNVKTIITWEELYDRIEYTGWYPDPVHLCPGDVKLWQCSADRYIVPGTDRTMDINAWNGTLEELAAWFGASVPDEPPAPALVEVGLKMEVLTDGLRVRTGPSSLSPIVGQLVMGQTVDVLDIGGTSSWVEITPGRWAAVQYGSSRYMRVKE